MSSTNSELNPPNDASGTSRLTKYRQEALSRCICSARIIAWDLSDVEGRQEAERRPSTHSLRDMIRSAASKPRRLLRSLRSRGRTSDVTSKTTGADDISTAEQVLDETLRTTIKMCDDIHYYKFERSADEEMKGWQELADTIKEDGVQFAEWTEGWGPRKLYDHFERRLTTAPGPLADGVAIACLAAQELLTYGAEGDLTTWEKLDGLASILGQADRKSTLKDLTERKVNRTNGSSGLSSVFELADREFCGTVSKMDESAKASARERLASLDSVAPRGTTLDKVLTSGITGAAWWDGKRIDWTGKGLETSGTNVIDFASGQ